jgi:hypothetical protein
MAHTISPKINAHGALLDAGGAGLCERVDVFLLRPLIFLRFFVKKLPLPELSELSQEIHRSNLFSQLYQKTHFSTTCARPTLKILSVIAFSSPVRLPAGC